jgi:3-hydroxyisobutyrate dehydrogenase-like beta-hydroxyacid dehydrogenase
MAKVAFIGLGRMGHGMAGRYLDSAMGGFAGGRGRWR